MNIAGYAVRHKAVTLVFALLAAVGGVLSYGKLGRLEDPSFTIKTAVIATQYPGATAEEVEQEVTERLETAIQRLKQLDDVRSVSRPGISVIYADVLDIYDKDTLPQVWDELRRKVTEGAAGLPPGCSKPSVNDDFGDVYGILFAVTGDGHTYHDLRKFADDLRRELLLCDNVGRVDFWGIQPEVVYVESDRVKLAQLGLAPQAIFTTIEQQNAVTAAGSVKVSKENMRLRVTGDPASPEDLGEVLIRGGEDRMIRVKDVARIERGYIDPPITLLRRNEQKAIGIGVSVVDGGNVVVMGDAVKAKLAELESTIPVGIEIHAISYEADTVREAVNGFVLSLFEAIFIVILVLVIFMGVREGLIIGTVLVLTILATFVGMKVLDVTLQRISIGALVIALGMLVDNAIVVAEGIVIKRHRGMNRYKASEEAVRETQWPLLGATCIAVLAFAAISVSQDKTGEFLGSLFKVIAISLGMSWVFAVTVCPYLCVLLLPAGTTKDRQPYNNRFYGAYRAFLRNCINRRGITICVTVMLLASAMYGFRYVPKSFFPDSTRPQFMVDLWMPEGTHIETTDEKLREMVEYISSLEGVTDINTFTGAGAMRFALTYSPELQSSAYGQLLVDVDDYRKISETLVPKIQRHLETVHPDAVIDAKAFQFGPGGAAIEARLLGPDGAELRRIAASVARIMEGEPDGHSVRSDWGARTKAASIRLAESRARKIGVTRTEIGNSLKMTFDGITTGLFRDDDDLLPIMLRPQRSQREGIGNLENIQVWSRTARQAVPINQVIDGVNTIWEEGAIHRRNRIRTITVSCRQRHGTSDALFHKLRGPVEAIPLPTGYKLEWGGEYENSRKANQKLMANVPLAFAMMFLITVILFNSLRHPIIIFLALPLAVIGVTAGLLITSRPFGFMPTLGVLSLAGMLIKNEIVLLDQIKLEIDAGKEDFTAVLDASMSRVRPVCLAAFTTVLGMIPLLWDAFFVAMAVTIMAGLTFATVLTLVVVPVLYATLFRVR